MNAGRHGLPWRQLQVETLESGLRVCLLENAQAPIVVTTMWYRAGSQDETDGAWGAAHFLEHMMFKGSRKYGPGEVDRRTQALGGSNNAFTSYDSTAYYFSFSGDRWHEALAIEADRLDGLTFDGTQLELERQVILEEIAMYEDDPWDALEQAVYAKLYDGHPYGRPVVGTADSVAALSVDDLRTFYRDNYRAANAVLVLAGDLEPGALEAAAERFDVASSASIRPEEPASRGRPEPTSELLRVERRRGDLARFLLALPIPGADDPAHAPTLLGLGALGWGRASRLQRRLVDDEAICLSVSVDASEMVDTGTAVISAELLPGVEPPRVEDVVFEELRRLRGGLDPEDLERSRQMALAHWVFGLERIHQQALFAAQAVAHFDADYPTRAHARLRKVGQGEVEAAARRFLDPERGAVLGWSLPAERTLEPHE